MDGNYAVQSTLDIDELNCLPLTTKSRITETEINKVPIKRKNIPSWMANKDNDDDVKEMATVSASTPKTPKIEKKFIKTENKIEKVHIMSDAELLDLQMLFNLMKQTYVSNIECDKPQQDNFSVQNLISEDASSDESKLRIIENGFIAESFIRPPINIKITFKEAIKLDKICFNSKVKSQISNGFVISTATSREENFRQVAKNINESNKECFNYEFKRRCTSTSIPETSNKNINIQYFSTSFIKYLDSVISINIQIMRTLNSTCPCLKSLKIYGSLVNTDKNKAVEENEVTKRESSNKTITIKNISIPVVFLDELTHELMQLPIRLPSGHTIDNSSLEKYLNEQKLVNENNYYSGVDPFTQIQFSNSYKPCIDDKLKGQIDKFLFDNRISKSELYNDEVVVSKKRKLNESEDALKLDSREAIFNSHSNTNFSKHLKFDDKNKNSSTACMCCLNKPNLNLLYEIRCCKHVFCRDCVFKIKNICIVCKCSFMTSDVENIRFRSNN